MVVAAGVELSPEARYVFEQTEVKWTGRLSRTVRTGAKMPMMYEITPVDHIVGSWKKWVRASDLYEIVKD